MIDIAARRFQQIVDRLLIHIRRAPIRKFLTILPRRIRGNNAGAVKTVKRNDLNIFYFNHIARHNRAAALSWNPPLQPCLNRFLWTDKRNGDLSAIFVRRLHTALNHMCRPLCRHVILMIVGCQNSVDLLECKRINHKRHISQIRLHGAASAHIRHLVSDRHFTISMSTLTVAAPEIHCYIGTAGGLEPYPRTTEPPHCDLPRRYVIVLNLLDQPRPPFGECSHDPAFSRDIRYLAHSSLRFAHQNINLMLYKAFMLL